MMVASGTEAEERRKGPEKKLLTIQKPLSGSLGN